MHKNKSSEEIRFHLLYVNNETDYLPTQRYETFVLCRLLAGRKEVNLAFWVKNESNKGPFYISSKMGSPCIATKDEHGVFLVLKKKKKKKKKKDSVHL